MLNTKCHPVCSKPKQMQPLRETTERTRSLVRRIHNRGGLQPQQRGSSYRSFDANRQSRFFKLLCVRLSTSIREPKEKDPHPASDTPGSSPLPHTSHSPQPELVRATRSACRLNRRMYFVRLRRSTGISHYRFVMLTSENLDERKTGRCDERRSIGVPGMRDVLARASSAPDLGTLRHPRVEKSACQEICGNSGFATGEERGHPNGAYLSCMSARNKGNVGRSEPRTLTATLRGKDRRVPKPTERTWLYLEVSSDVSGGWEVI